MNETQKAELKENPRQFLGRYRDLYEKIEAKEERVWKYRGLAEKITAEVKIDGGFGGGVSNKVEDCAANIIDLQNEIKIDKQVLYTEKQLVLEAIEMLPAKNDMRRVLNLKFTEFKTWAEIARIIGKSYRWIMALYEQSLKFFKEI